MESEEPMDVDGGEFEKFDELLEEGECEEVESNRISRKLVSDDVPEPLRTKTLVTGIDIFGEEAQEKLEERAKRFGIKEEKFSLKDAQNLYESFGIIEGTDHALNYKLNVINMRGTEKMTTKDVLKYFEDYAPASIQWINDMSCNVMWLDKVSAARAILGLSKKITGSQKSLGCKMNSDDETDEGSDDDVIINGDNEKEENAIHVKDIRCPIPPGIWRKGRDYKDTRDIFLRFATRNDIRLHTADKPALKGILTNSRKRAYKQREPTPPPIIANGIAAKNPWGSLSKNWGVTDFVEDDYLPKKPIEPPSVSNVKARLGSRSRDREDLVDDNDDYDDYDNDDNGTVIELSDDSVKVPEEDSAEEESSSDEDNWCRRSKLPRMRMHADDEEAKIQKRKGKIRSLASQSARIAGDNYGEYDDYEVMDNVDEIDHLRRDRDLRSRDIKRESDLRKRLTARRRVPPQAQPKLQPDIQVVLTNPKLLTTPKVLKGNFSNIDVTEDEYEDDDDRPPIVVHPGDDDDEEEEGEIIDDSESDGKVEYENEEEEEEEEEEVEAEEEEEEEDDVEERVEIDSGTDTETSDSSIEEKEVQGPKGSVIKVVPRKPKLQSTVSTVWSRLNTSRNNKHDDTSPERPRLRDLRHSLKKTDLRSRIGNNHMRGRSPLRIELRNDKYAGRRSDSD